MPRRSNAWRWRRSRRRTSRSWTTYGPWVSPTTCSTSGWPSSLRSSRVRLASGGSAVGRRPTCGSRGASTTTPARSTRRGWPASSTSGRSARVGATTRWPPTAARVFPGVGISFGVTRALAPLFTRGLIGASRTSPSCVLVAVVVRGDPGRLSTLWPAAALAGDRHARSRRRRTSSASRSATPTAEASRTSGSPALEGAPGRGQGHPLRRPGGADGSTWTPPDADLHADGHPRLAV